jgi:glycosyltransferase involved in cell wall biosynthesis
MSKRLAFFSQSLGGGGAERVIVTLANEFVKRGYIVDIVNSYHKEGYQKLLAPEVNVVVLNTRRRLLAAPRLARYLRRYRPHALLATVNTMAAVAARMLAHVPTRIVLREATTPSQELRHKQVSERARRIRKLGLRWLYPRANAIVTVSRGVAEDILRFAPGVGAKISVIYNPVISEDMFRLAEEPVSHRWFLPHCPPVVLAAGRLVALKGFDTLLMAFAQLLQYLDAHLVILGEGEERTSLEQLAETLNIRSKVDFPGFDPNPFRYMRRASVFVLSSRYEGLPNVLIQAMACGCPVVSTNCPSGPDEILDGGKYGALVPVDDAEAMAQAILRVLQGERKPVPQEWLEQFKVESIATRYLQVMVGQSDGYDIPLSH